MNDRYVQCNYCGAYLEKSDCEYCGQESNYIFMSVEEIMELQKYNQYIPSDLSGIAMYMGKQIVRVY